MQKVITMQDNKAQPLTEQEKKVIALCREVQKQGWGTVEIIVKDGKLARAKAGKEVKLD